MISRAYGGKAGGRPKVEKGELISRAYGGKDHLLPELDALLFDKPRIRRESSAEAPEAADVVDKPRIRREREDDFDVVAFAD